MCHCCIPASAHELGYAFISQDAGRGRLFNIADDATGYRCVAPQVSYGYPKAARYLYRNYSAKLQSNGLANQDGAERIKHPKALLAGGRKIATDAGKHVCPSQAAETSRHLQLHFRHP